MEQSNQTADAEISGINTQEYCAAIKGKYLDFKWQYTVGGN